jgi:hypothetical protein
MNVDFTPEQQPFVQHAIESGRIHRPEDAVEEALSLWVERERAAHYFGTRGFDKARAQAAATRMREQRKRHILPPGVTIRSMIDEGRD